MKILGLSDQVNPFVYSDQIAERFSEIDLVVGCGDLPADYLEFVVSTLNVPVLYVAGNHDVDEYKVPGGLNIDGRSKAVKGVRVLGLGGSPRYKEKGKHQYTEREMVFRAFKLLPGIFVQRYLLKREIDILVTHAPPRGIHDMKDPAHQGFIIFRNLIRYARPKLMLHGHSHATRSLEVTETVFEGCTFFNVFPYRVVELPNRVE